MPHHRLHPLNPDLAATFVRRRRALGLSQNAIALRAGLTESTLARYETLRSPISPSAMQAIERALAEVEQQRLAVAS